MEFYYVSHWKACGDGSFALHGIIAVGRQQVGAYFPEDHAEETEFRRTHREWRHLQNRDDPLMWLRQVARGGNGVTEEYDEVRVIAAPSLQQALRDAYTQTLREYGSPISLYSQDAAVAVEDRGDPFADLFSETEVLRRTDGLHRRVMPPGGPKTLGA